MYNGIVCFRRPDHKWGMTMNKRITATVIIAGMMFSVTSCRKAFCYKTNDANTCHTIIEANDIANMVDKGF